MYTPDCHVKVHQIRLLTLLPGSFLVQDDSSIQISVKIVQFTKGNVSKVKALSSAWGYTEDPLEILMEPNLNRHFLMSHETSTMLYTIYAMWLDHESSGSMQSVSTSRISPNAALKTGERRISTAGAVWVGSEAVEISLAMVFFSRILRHCLLYS